MTTAIALLSWKGYDNLKTSLQSYRAAGLFDLFDERVIYLPEQRREETALAEEYGLKIFGSPENKGILHGFQSLAQCATAKYVLLLENDCPIIEDEAEMKRQIAHARETLAAGRANVVRLRSREFPGQDWACERKYREYYPEDNADSFTKIKACVKRAFRPGKARRVQALSLYQGLAEFQKHHNIGNYDAEDDCYYISSRLINWTNQSVMIEREFFLNVIIAYAEKANTRRGANGFKNLEIEMNSDFWREGGFTVCVEKGLFTHRRIGDRGYKIKP